MSSYTSKTLKQNATVLGVLTYIFFTFSSFIIIVALPFDWFSFNTFFGTATNIIFFYYFTMICTNYILSSYLNPGRVPKGWIPEGASDEEIQAAKKTSDDIHSTKRAVWCHECENFKPKRTHHCRRCNKCTLKMDHHCIWTENCVGHNNHKYFFLFLFYASIGLVHGLSLFLYRLIRMGMYPEEDNGFHKFLIILHFFVTLPVTMGICYLFYHQIEIIIKNTTSIEVSVRRWQEFDAKEAKQPYRWAYDYGIIGNISSVLGSSILLWFVPTPAETDGIHWKIMNASSSV